MISKTAITNYLGSPRENFVWVKKLSEAQLDQELRNISFDSPHFDKLMLHQKACILLGIAYPNLCFWLSMGVGKTLITLNLLNFFYQNGFLVAKTLILAPTDEVVNSWENEIKKWYPDLPYTTLLGSTDEKWEKFNSLDSGLIIATYVGVAFMVSTLQPSKKKEKNELVVDPRKLPDLVTDVEALILDESTKVANHQSLSFKVCSQIGKHCSIRYALAGRPFGRDPMSLWAQFYLVDRGETLSPFIGFYRETFFKKRPLIWHPNAIEYIFDEKRKADLSRITAHRSISYALDECVSLPDLVRIKRYVSFPEETLAYYNGLIRDMIAAKGDISLVKNVFLRMRQLSSGFLGIKDDETGDKSEIEFESNPKLDLLMDLIEELPEDRKCIVFYEYTYSGRLISKTLKKHKIKAGWLWSGTKNWKQMEEEFREDPAFKVLVINSKKGAYGLNLQHSNYCFVYESPVSGIDRDQAEKRIHRTGQKHTCFIYDLIMRGSMDERILEYQTEGRSLFQALVSEPAKVLRN
jgi:SNF2 family DNA or RNA helicase